MPNNDRFNAEAAAWDKNPFVHAMSLEAWKAIKKYTHPLFDNDIRPDVLEVGCGTGLLSLEIAPSANRLIAIDAAEGMIEVLSSKLTQPGMPKNIVPLAILLEDPEDKRLPAAENVEDGTRARYDLIVSHLVLHHISDHKPVLKTMLGCLRRGGMVALTDFEDFGPEARKFHPESKMEGVEHHGIPAEEMANMMREVGFEEVSVRVAWEHSKLVEKYPGEFKKSEPAKGEGELMKFTYLICLGRKP